MASPESQDLVNLYKGWVAAMQAKPDMELEEIRKLFGHWGDVTVDPRGVDYIEVDVEGIPAMWAIPKNSVQDRALLCSHGGGYVVGSMYTHRKLFGHIAKAVGCRALIVDYRRAPENPHPGPVNDMATAYRWLLEHEKLSPSHIALTGDSAGGALALTTIARIRELGLPLPAATMPMSPWAGWDTSGKTYDTNKDKDALVSRDTTEALGSLFIGNGDPKHPLANPLYTDYTGFPPIYIQVGDAETLLDDSLRIAERAKAAGADVRIDVYPEMQHVFQFLAGNAPEADESIQRMAAWVRPKIGL
ncbi:alpha/beta hydrolase [Extensimonas vulgaris]|uniref:Acetyl esterase/lipase n=1 Tax=Extensimonas vulgaris TaxID=1031594 RepID=A0A369AK49_9BURK|nr:alpha/beta hydrolase [Extensimonas vulgaris]RCX09779.1 acetyl esterase/lipase [Extensimonas vulgaris]TWI39409.1 acetyl esterase/lipase [Extensimonas vulgaris]TXD15654.1 alpha/beta hydrolase [Extensimonas vulgaris]